MLHRSILAIAAIAPTVLAAPIARADVVTITYSAAGQYSPDFTAICGSAAVCNYGTENFSAWQGQTNFVSQFTDAGAGTYSTAAGVSFTGTWSAGPDTTFGAHGEWVKQAQNIYGGVNGAAYPELYGPPAIGASGSASTYQLSIAAAGVPGANYFGVWISALDAHNNLTIYDGTSVIAQFNSTVLLAALGSCGGAVANPYCGNPTPQFSGADSGELFAYVNVFDTSGLITNVVFSDNGATGFETTNQAVAYLSNVQPSGTVLETSTPVPEPGTVGLLGFVLFAMGVVTRRGRVLSSVNSIRDRAAAVVR